MRFVSSAGPTFRHHEDVSSCCAPASGRDASAVPTPRAAPKTAARGLVAVPGGTFQMGYDGPLANRGEGEGRVRRVTLPPYRIGETTVTNQQFAAFVKATGYVTEAEAS